MATTSSITPHSIRNSAAKTGFERLSEALKAHDLGLILDFVPNHVGVHFADNPWWLDVLEWGPASPHAASFDIDWDILPYRPRGRRAAADPRLLLWRGAGKGRDRASLRCRRRQLLGLVFRAPAADRAAALRRDPAPCVVSEAGAEAAPAGQAHCSSSRRAIEGRAIPIARKRPASKRSCRHRRRRRDHRARARRPIAPGRIARRRRLRCITCWSASITGSAHWRLACSDINYRRFFDVNTLAGLAGRGRRHVRGDPSPGRTADRGRQAARPAARSHRRPARSRTIFSAAAAADPRRRRAGDRIHSTS